MPLPIPQRPWSHNIDFITDLPTSEGMTTIVTIGDQFSKPLHLIPLPSLPTAFSLAELLFTQVFRIYGLPEDIVSDRGPQFTSRARCQVTIPNLMDKWKEPTRKSDNIYVLTVPRTRLSGLAISLELSMHRTL